MSLIIKGMKLPQHAAVNGEKGTAYKCVILAHPDNSVELVIDIKFASAYDNGHNIQSYPLTEIPTPHGDLVDRDDLIDEINRVTFVKRYDYDVAYNIVTDAETIIEAEVSE
ncbi:MAG: hypothetical protein IIY54_00075 [Ruminococcus sp.]|nr:hypothetical protein [Ruminococcus sp.]